jgi:UDP-N-acetylmuramate: L-alanyl-gamma-D-glutamyl-meso-diaminopimelate ligase
MELIQSTETNLVFKDFAHSPSKLKATTQALKEQYPERKLVACMELHTFSSLSVGFLDEYRGTMSKADVAMVYFSPKSLAHKKLPPITVQQIKDAFASSNIRVYNDGAELVTDLMMERDTNTNFLLMSSGNFGGMNIDDIGKELTRLEKA